MKLAAINPLKLSWEPEANEKLLDLTQTFLRSSIPKTPGCLLIVACGLF